MNKPVRVQRKRIRGWRIPENTIYVGRPSKWGNPFKTAETFENWFYRAAIIQPDGTTSGAGEHYRKMVSKELRGKNLMCWCPMKKRCHADVLLQFANAD